MRQRLARELLDDDLGTPEEIRRSLQDLWWIHRHLGGASSWRKLLRRVPAAESLLDVGAGTGQVARWLGELTGARQVVALDRRATHFAPEGLRVAGDAFRLPFADACFDLVTCNLFLHHFHGAEAERLLTEMRRVARRAVVVNDLERAWPPYVVVQALGRGLGFSRITRYDGPRSVRQAYSAGEMRALGQAAAGAEVVRLWPYRLGMIWRRT